MKVILIRQFKDTEPLWTTTPGNWIVAEEPEHKVWWCEAVVDVITRVRSCLTKEFS